MNNIFTIRIKKWRAPARLIQRITPEAWVVILAAVAAIVGTVFSFTHGYIIAYGDAESHLNIAKRVISSLTPGLAQIGGIWLPLPHILLLPFVYFDSLWHSGLAGSIVSGVAFIAAALYTYRFSYLLTEHKGASFVAACALILNPNILYLQSTPMTELTLIVFFVLSSYYFVRFLLDDSKILMLILAALFGFFASLSRYDGWALVMMEAGILALYYSPFNFEFISSLKISRPYFNFSRPNMGMFKERWRLLEGRIILFSTLAFFGVFIWFLWDALILGDPLYFTHSQFSANSQQMGWLAKGQLPAYHNPFAALLYYLLTSMESMGSILSVAAMVGVYVFVRDNVKRNLFFILPVVLVPFIFNVLTLYLGQSIIFLPGLTPSSFESTLFNVRYGVMMVFVFSLFIGYLFFRLQLLGRVVVVALMAIQSLLFFIGFTPVLSLMDGIHGLSSNSAKVPDAQYWFAQHYDYGIILEDDYARMISIVRTKVSMRDVIYIGNKPYWEQSLVEPQRYARWVIIQPNDALWKGIYEHPEIQGRLYKYFNKVYTSQDILIFKRMDSNQP